MLLAVLAVFIFQTITFMFAARYKNNGLADISWGMGFVTITLTLLSAIPQPTVWQILFSGAIVIWGLRLSAYLFIRNAGKKEDERYAAWRADWLKKGERYTFIRSYAQVFLLQGLLLILVATPIYGILLFSKNNHPFLFYIGAIIWLFGFIYEAVSDYQKSKFKSDPNNKNIPCTIGLWKLSRHPNYFGEIVLWWGLSLMAFSVSHVWVFAGPLLLSWLILKVSGIPMLTARYKNIPAYKEYLEKTPALVPFWK